MSRFDECDEVTASATDLCHLKSDERRRQNETGFTKKIFKSFLGFHICDRDNWLSKFGKKCFCVPGFPALKSLCKCFVVSY